MPREIPEYFPRQQLSQTDIIQYLLLKSEHSALRLLIILSLYNTNLLIAFELRRKFRKFARKMTVSLSQRIFHLEISENRPILRPQKAKLLLKYSHGGLINSQPPELYKNVQSAQFWTAIVVIVHKGQISTRTKQNPTNRDG